MTRIVLLALGLLAGLPTSGSERHTIGMIEATVDGEPTHWVSFDTANGPGAMWRDEGTGTGTLTMGGFEVTDLDPQDPAWQGSQIAISVQFPLESTEVSHELLAAGGGASVELIPDADLDRTLTLQEGRVQMTRGPLTGAAHRFEGHFSGTLVDAEGRPAARISEGRFVIEEATKVRLPP